MINVSLHSDNGNVGVAFKWSVTLNNKTLPFTGQVRYISFRAPEVDKNEEIMVVIEQMMPIVTSLAPQYQIITRNLKIKLTANPKDYLVDSPI